MHWLIIFTLALTACGTKFANNLQPMYGNGFKTQEMIASDEEFIATCIQQDGTRELASRHASKRGWDFFYRGDADTAMKRFNQAWLLDPNNPETHWGFGIIMSTRMDLEEAEKHFSRALELDPNNGRLLSDAAFCKVNCGSAFSSAPNAQQGYFKDAESLFERGLAADNKYPLLHFQWAILKYHQRDYKGAWEKISDAQKRGMTERDMDPQFLEELKSKLPKP